MIKQPQNKNCTPRHDIPAPVPANTVYPGTKEDFELSKEFRLKFCLREHCSLGTGTYCVRTVLWIRIRSDPERFGQVGYGSGIIVPDSTGSDQICI